MVTHVGFCFIAVMRSQLRAHSVNNVNKNSMWGRNKNRAINGN
jgi:hypothetical protein